ncbi:MAG: UTRA domain-containing protein [Pseudomonadota bacterium]
MRTTYQEVKASVLSRIRQNIWPPGASIPGEVELAEEFGCARATVNRAMRELVDEGIVERKRKAGTRVKTSPTLSARFFIPLVREEIARTGAQYRYALVERDIRTAPGWLRAQVQIARGAEILYVRCMHYASNKPYQLEDRWINLAAVPEARHQGFDTVGPNEWLVQEVPLTDGELAFSATSASADIADFLDISNGDPVFTLERTTWLSGLNVTYARLYFAAGYKMISQI